MKRKEFEKLVIKAIDKLPENFKDKLENIDIVIESEPAEQMGKRFMIE